LSLAVTIINASLKCINTAASGAKTTPKERFLVLFCLLYRLLCSVVLSVVYALAVSLWLVVCSVDIKKAALLSGYNFISSGELILKNTSQF